MVSGDDHHGVVDLWLQRVGGELGTGELLELLELATKAIYLSAGKTLSGLMLTAVLDRVIVHARERFPAMVGLEVNGTGVSSRLVREAQPAPGREEVLAAIAYVLTEFLTVLGNLTAEILSHRLHATLNRVSFLRAQPGYAPPSDPKATKK